MHMHYDGLQYSERDRDSSATSNFTSYIRTATNNVMNPHHISAQ